MPSITALRLRSQIAGVLLLGGCSAPSPEPGTLDSDPDWSDRQEQIHQLQEVIRYEDEEERVRREALQSLTLSVDPAAATEAGVTAGKGEDQHQQ